MAFAFIADLGLSVSLLFVLCLLAVCLFEAINGFHDTANAVATVIYTKTLDPMVAVIWSGFWNFLGVILGGIAVAMGIVKLIPLNDLMIVPLGENISLVMAILISSIAWNLGTWYFGIPCSSSHTLIGSLLGAGFAFHSIHPGEGLNWAKATEIGWSLLLSPFFGFGLAVILMYILRQTFKKNKELFEEPGKKRPPMWIRGILVVTCTLVSFFHGSNDGQKGVGLLLVVLIAFLPLQYAFNASVPLDQYRTAARNLETTLARNVTTPDSLHIRAIAAQAGTAASLMDTVNVKDKLQLFSLRKSIQSLTKVIDSDLKNQIIPNAVAGEVRSNMKLLKTSYEFAPRWAIILISLCLGLGTMIGWKRIVVTIGEKIGKTHLTYAQGASAELCAAATIGISTGLGLPVSTTQVLSSGIAGTMVATGGMKNLQRKTMRNIALAWVLTLPVTFLLAAGMFFFLRVVF